MINFSSIDEIKKDCIEKEIDSFRRDSYIDQFKELEKKFNIQSLRLFDEWASFVECSQRRNLITHNDGKVNKQYLSIVSQEKYIPPKKVRVGDILEIDPEYLLNSIFLINKVGFMLAHTLWRKTLPNDLKVADVCMNNSIYDLMSQKRWKLASEIGSFGLQDIMLKNSESLHKMIRVINTAIALKNLGKKTEVSNLLDTVDWSSSIREFKLAIAVLKEDYDNAAKIMIEIGKKGELINEVFYYEWPLFEEFRGTKAFQDAFFKIYKKPFKDKLTKNLIPRK